MYNHEKSLRLKQTLWPGSHGPKLNWIVRCLWTKLVSDLIRTTRERQRDHGNAERKLRITSHCATDNNSNAATYSTGTQQAVILNCTVIIWKFSNFITATISKCKPSRPSQPTKMLAALQSAEWHLTSSSATETYRFYPHRIMQQAYPRLLNFSITSSPFSPSSIGLLDCKKVKHISCRQWFLFPMPTSGRGISCSWLLRLTSSTRVRYGNRVRRGKESFASENPVHGFFYCQKN